MFTFTATTLTTRSVELLSNRNLNQDQITQFKQLLQQAKHTPGSAKQQLHSLNQTQLSLIQQAHALADAININELSDEGAQNLLNQPDFSQSVDINNDGIVEVGSGRALVFPPVNAPQTVKTAYENTTKHLDEKDKAILSFHMHLAIYGTNLNEAHQRRVPPSHIWSKEGVERLFTQLQSNLEFNVARDGWTSHNKMLKQFYQQFEEQLSESVIVTDTANLNQQTDKVEQQIKKTNDFMQMILDARLQLDREKIEEIDQKIEAISKDTSLTDEQKSQLITQLEKQKIQEYEQAKDKLIEQEKRKAQLT